MQMGSWDYYTVKMDMASVASEISCATDVNQDKTLDAHIQRDVGITRAKKQIVKNIATKKTFISLFKLLFMNVALI